MGVSILIPAFKPTYLRQAIASALTQEVEDLEILISDDSGGDEIRPIVERFRDPRIVYMRTAGRIGAAENCASLWTAARHDLIQYLLDDDLLMPHALAELTRHARQRPDASIYFGTRYVIDRDGCVTTAPQSRGKPVFDIDGPVMSASLLPNLRNLIGEFNNVLMNRGAGLTPDHFTRYEGFDIRVLCDVGLYLRASQLAPAVGIDLPVASFRLHGDQNSSPDTNPLFPIGLAEWEIFVRGERSGGRLGREQALQAVGRLKTVYANWAGRMPPLRIVEATIDDLRLRIEAGDTDLLDEDFRVRWEDFVAAVLETRARRSEIGRA